ncbi:hypothetical protein LOC67_26740 [Stieleria sp. JC731]|uniref:hypothetical protein n=1 Tax=Pirellulaceae TaxID=2691357 RepID=UPI001E4993E1|nr:hypothetical protein [Stieleria sp. JC731]MCC9604167.1 hypothetical protein [Stieleria sp. JC731]
MLRRFSWMHQRTFRSAYTLIELVSAVTSATILLLGLATSVGVSIDVLDDASEDVEVGQAKRIEDQLHTDLRYASTFQILGPTTVLIERPDSTGTIESVLYQTGNDQLTRSVGGNVQVLSSQSPSATNYTDSLNAAELATQSNVRPRIRDFTTAQTTGSADSALTIQVPDGARTGDLLMVVCGFRNTFDVLPLSSGWTRSHYTAGNYIGIATDYSYKEDATPSNLTIGFYPYADVAAVMLAIENPKSNWPFGWAGASYGSSDQSVASTHPAAIENSSTIDTGTLNLNFFAAAGHPFYDSGTRLSGFNDAAVVTGSPWTYGACTLATTFRTGPLPSLEFTPRVQHRYSTDWVTMAVEVEGANP